MSKTKKLVPKQRFRKFISTKEWQEVKLEDVSEIIGGGTPNTSISAFWNGDIDWYSPTEIGNKIYISQSEKKITQLGLSKSSAKILPIGTVLYTSRAGIGNTAILAKEATTNQGFQSIVPKQDRLNSYFLYSRTKELKRYGEAKGGGSTFKEISGKQLAQMPIFLPALSEQTQIGEFFKKLDDLIQTQQKKLEKTKTLKSAYLAEMFPCDCKLKPKLQFKDFINYWDSISLNKIGSTYAGLSGKSKDDFGHGNAEYITYVNIFNNPITDLDGTETIEIDDKQNQVKYGDVLFTVSSETPHEVGLSSVWLGDRENVYLNSFCFGFRPYLNVDNYYFAFMLRSPVIRKKFKILAQGISRYNISKNRVMKLVVPITHINEQTKIGNFFKLLDKKIALEQRKLDKLNNIKQAYLNEMFV